MATTSAETSSSSGPNRQRRRDRMPTTLDSDVTKPQITQPGDAPYDTTDPYERASSVTPDKAAAAMAGHGVVNAVVHLPEPERHTPEKGDDRTEEVEHIGPDGKLVRVKRNIETGHSEMA